MRRIAALVVVVTLFYSTATHQTILPYLPIWLYCATVSFIRIQQPFIENGSQDQHQEIRNYECQWTAGFLHWWAQIEESGPPQISQQLCHQGLQARWKDNTTDSGCVMRDGEAQGQGFWLWRSDSRDETQSIQSVHHSTNDVWKWNLDPISSSHQLQASKNHPAAAPEINS